jgi:hypothetical protein
VIEREVPRVATPVEVPALLEALRRAWRALLDTTPSEDALALLAAHWAFETGWGKVGGWNWNLGNRKHVDGDGRDFFFQSCEEEINGKSVTLHPPDPGCRFVSLPTLADGAHDYLGLLHGQYVKAWPAVEAGDPADFAHRLKTLRYYTDSEAHYTATLIACFMQAKRILAAIPPPVLQKTGDLGELARDTALADDVDAGKEGLDALPSADS